MEKKKLRVDRRTKFNYIHDSVLFEILSWYMKKLKQLRSPFHVTYWS